VAAQQELSEEMKRLQAQQVYRRPVESPAGGIPVDSEYIIFIIAHRPGRGGRAGRR
jgi:hypothetical protein